MQKQQELYQKAQSLLRSGDMQNAADCCERALQQFPGDANLMVLAARARLALRQFEVARTHAGKAISLYPAFAAAHDVLGDVLLVLGEAESALQSYQVSLDLGGQESIAGPKMARARQTMELFANGPMPRR